MGIATQAFAVIDTLTIDREADLLADGTVVRVTGQARCTAGDTAFINVAIFQPHGRVFAEGGGNSGLFICDGSLQTWEVFVQSFLDTFQNGPASAVAQMFTNGPSGPDNQSVSVTIHLHK